MLSKQSIFAKLLLVYLVVVLLVVSCLNFVLIWFFRDYLYDQNREVLLDSLNQVENITNSYVSGQVNLHKFQHILRIIDRSSNVHGCLLNSHNQVFFNSYGNFNPALLTREAPLLRLRLQTEDCLVTTVRNQHDPSLDIMLAASLVKTDPGFMVVAYMPMADTTSGLGEILRLIWWASLLVLALSIPFLYWLSRHITHPLQQMEELARRMASGDLSIQMEVNRQDEIGRLAQSFNTMVSELARTEKYRQEFLANVSHELRTPLTTVKGFVLALLDDTIPYGQREHYLSRIYLAVDRLSRIVSDLLDLARLKSGKIELAREPVDAWQICREVAEDMKPIAEQQNISLAVNIPNTAGLILGDRCRIIQIMANLLDNAIKFSPPGSTVFLAGEACQYQLQVHVTDQGPGIDPAELPYLFERFYRGHSNAASGTGLGLAIARLLAESHGGEITVVSDVGQGSTFTLCLPLLQNSYN